MLAVVVMAGGALVTGARRARRPLAAVAALLAVVAVVLTIAPGLLPDQRLDTSKTPIPPGTLIASGWGSVLRVDVARAPGHPNIDNLYHDGILGASIDRWNGTRAFLARYDYPHDSRSLPFRVLGKPPRQEAIIGAAGGHEVLASLYYDAQHVDAVELNPVTVRYVTTTFADFDGHLAQNPHVSYINADGRSFMARTNKHYDLVYYPAPDSYAATNGALSSAYVLSESYLYTVNGIQSMLAAPHSARPLRGPVRRGGRRLRPSHVTIRGHGPPGAGQPGDRRPQTPHPGGDDHPDHLPRASPCPPSSCRRALSPPQRSTVSSAGSRPSVTPRCSARTGQAPTPNPVNDVVATSNAQLGSFYASYPYNITPTTDNDPFFYHFARFGTVIRNFFHSLTSVDRENSVGERVLLLLLVLSVIAATVFLLLPFLAIRDQWRQLPRKGLSGVFFAGVGFGFIFFEITLMQLLNLFLGFPTYSLTITLMALLVFTGSVRWPVNESRQRRRAIPILLLVLAGLCLFYLLGLTSMTNALLGLPLAARILITFVVLAPLGICFGMFMPIGLGEIANLGEYPQQYVAWGWAVNGFASVVGSALAIVLAMSFGFDFVLGLGLGCYLVATLAWFRLGAGSRSLT